MLGDRPPAAASSSHHDRRFIRRSSSQRTRAPTTAITPDQLPSPAAPPPPPPTAEELDLRNRLRFHFLDFLSKWRVRRRFPWKFALQVIKVILITTQLYFFAQMRVSHISFLQRSTTVFRHLFFPSWSDTRDIQTYPPAAGPYALYTYDEFYTHLQYAIQRYYTLNASAIGHFDYGDLNDKGVPRPKLCVTYLQATGAKGNQSCITVSNTTTVDAMRKELAGGNVNLNFDDIHNVVLSARVRAEHLRNLQPYDIPDCFLFNLQLVFDNEEHNGVLLLDIATDIDYVSRCNRHQIDVDMSTTNKLLLDLLDAAVILMCVFSLLLCMRALLRAELLKRECVRFFARRGLQVHDTSVFLNLWYVFICLNDLFTLVGTTLKLCIQFKSFDSDVFSAAGILLGCGNILVWCGLLRYLQFFSQYNILILTLKKAVPSIARFILCSSFVYMGFVFCGWTVLGPYHYKFRDIMASSECLFSLINGDDMFATFDTMAHSNSSVWWFSRVYLYGFICLFIYAVLSLFIAIIMDAYEVVKDRYDPSEQASLLQQFIDGTLEALPPQMEEIPIEESSVIDRLNAFVEGVRSRFTRFGRQRSSYQQL